MIAEQQVTREQLLDAISKVTPEEKKAAARLRINRALSHIQDAQNSLNSACAELSTLEGAIPIWKASSKLSDTVKAFWYRVDNFRKTGKFKLDSMHVEVIARQKAGLPRF